MEFARVLVVAVILFGVLFILFSGEFEGGISRVPERGFEFRISTRNVTPEEGVITQPGFFYVGPSEREEVKRIDLNQGKSFPVKKEVKIDDLFKRKSVEIKNGPLSYKEGRFKFKMSEEELNKLRGIRLSFSVNKTNSIGQLLISLNDRLIFSGFPNTSREIRINPALLNKKNLLTVYSGSPGVRFWKTSYYKLKELQIEEITIIQESQSFGFSLPEKIFKKLKLGRLFITSSLREGTGKLRVSINKNEVFSKIPKQLETLDFSLEDVNLTARGNTISFYSEKNSKYRLKSSLLFFWNETNVGTIGLSLYTSSENYYSLPGRMTFKIDRIIDSPRTLVLKVIDGDGREHKTRLRDLDEGKVVDVTLEKRHLTIGPNKVVFSVEGQGGYRIEDFKVVF